MRCPHCKYINGYDHDKCKTVYGKSGHFFSLPIEMKRESTDMYFSDDTTKVYSCPSCNKLFINN